MADEGEHIHVESESNAGKWILLVLALLVVAGIMDEAGGGIEPAGPPGRDDAG